MITELEPAAVAPVDLDAFAAHLRVASGFAGAPDEAALIERCARAAGAGIEGLVGKRLIRRRFKWTVSRWRDPARVAIPLAPVAQVNAVTVIDAEGVWQSVDSDRWVLIPDGFRPVLAGRGGRLLPGIPADGVAEVEVVAGYGDAPEDIPEELRQAVMLLGAQYYEQRHAAAEGLDELPCGVRDLVARHRELRL
ncbi:MAG: hypothetical protein CML43_16805 [Rhodobacteraceae bacterium]|nr:hypothetical protein [Paracoccaceae bacterium]